MKNILSCILLLTFILVGGHAKGTETSDSAENLIQKLYEKHQPQKGVEVSFDNEKTLREYFTTGLVTLFMRNAECMARTHEVCNLNMDPVLDAQDYDQSPRNLEITKIKSNESMLRFNVSFTNMRHRKTLIYEVVKTKSGWRIKDIVYPSGNRLSTLLSEPE